MPTNSTHTDRPPIARKRAGYDPASDIVRPRHLPQAAGISQKTAWKLRRAGKFPEPIQLTPGAKGWRRAAIEQWIEQRASAGTNEAA